MVVEVPRDQEISGGENIGGKKESSSAVCQRRTNKGSIDIKERERGGAV